MSNSELVLDRLKSVFNVSNDTELASKMGLKRSTLGAWRSRGSIPYAECVNIALSRKISLDWLLTGEGEMLKGQVAPIAHHEDLLYIPEYNVELSAGFGAYPEDHALSVGNRPFTASWLKKKGLHAKDLKLVRVAGDSMEPLLRNKDVVMIDSSRTRPSEAMPFAVRLDDDLLVKSIQRLGDGNLALVSHNKTYDNIIINQANPPQDFQVIGAVVWHAHSFI